MKNILYLIVFTFCLSAMNSQAQFAQFTKNGVIEYEKSVNMFSVLKPKNDDNIWQKEFYDKYKNETSIVKLRSYLMNWVNNEKKFDTKNTNANENVKRPDLKRLN